MGTMHPDEVGIDAALVRRLLRAQFPRWADLPITRLASGGTVNAIYRLGEDLTARLPLRPDGNEAIATEARLLPRLAPLLPLPIPEVVATGAPGEGYPLPWAVHRWIEGRNPVEGDVAEPQRMARDLAEFAVALRGIDLPDGPPAHRGAPLIDEDREMRAAIEALRGTDERPGLAAGAGPCPWPSSSCPTTGTPIPSSRPTPGTSSERSSGPGDRDRLQWDPMRLSAAEARSRFVGSRVARLATVSADGVPHLVPVTFAVLGDRIVFVVDDKPKSTTRLRRLDNIAARPSVCLLVDVYDDDWARLWWARADGSATVLTTDTEAVDALAARYPAYVERRPGGPVVSIAVTTWRGWAATDTG